MKTMAATVSPRRLILGLLAATALTGCASKAPPQAYFQPGPGVRTLFALTKAFARFEVIAEQRCVGPAAASPECVEAQKTADILKPAGATVLDTLLEGGGYMDQTKAIQLFFGVHTQLERLRFAAELKCVAPKTAKQKAYCQEGEAFFNALGPLGAVALQVVSAPVSAKQGFDLSTLGPYLDLALKIAVKAADILL